VAAAGLAVLSFSFKYYDWWVNCAHKIDLPSLFIATEAAACASSSNEAALLTLSSTLSLSSWLLRGGDGVNRNIANNEQLTCNLPNSGQPLYKTWVWGDSAILCKLRAISVVINIFTVQLYLDRICTFTKILEIIFFPSGLFSLSLKKRVSEWLR